MMLAASACATTPRPVAEKPTTAPTVPIVAPAQPFVRTSPPPSLPATARTRPVVHTRTLKNGLKVVVVEDHRARLVQTRLFFASGSAADFDDRAGATWFARAAG